MDLLEEIDDVVGEERGDIFDQLHNAIRDAMYDIYISTETERGREGPEEHSIIDDDEKDKFAYEVVDIVRRLGFK